MMLEFRHPFPVVTPLGEAYALYVTNAGMWENDVWLCVLDDGRLLHFTTNQLKYVGNGSYDMKKPRPLQVVPYCEDRGPVDETSALAVHQIVMTPGIGGATAGARCIEPGGLLTHDKARVTCRVCKALFESPNAPENHIRNCVCADPNCAGKRPGAVVHIKTIKPHPDDGQNAPATACGLFEERHPGLKFSSLGTGTSPTCLACVKAEAADAWGHLSRLTDVMRGAGLGAEDPASWLRDKLGRSRKPVHRAWPLGSPSHARCAQAGADLFTTNLDLVTCEQCRAA